MPKVSHNIPEDSLNLSVISLFFTTERTLAASDAAYERVDVLCRVSLEMHRCYERTEPRRGICLVSVPTYLYNILEESLSVVPSRTYTFYGCFRCRSWNGPMCCIVE